MRKTLGGITFVHNAITYDYNYKETIDCLLSFCDKVVILDAGSTDGTAEEVSKYADPNVTVACLDKLEWEKQQGREKLSYFQNLALSFLDTDYYFLLQADEILHEKSFPLIHRIIQTNTEAFICSRRNLWKDCFHQLNVPHERKPCSTEIVRLAKTQYKSVGDGESIDAPASGQFIYGIDIWHMGFVRKKEVMKDKIWNMQENVFQIPHDPKLDNMAEFDWSAWFSENDLIKINETHPVFIREWISSRP